MNDFFEMAEHSIKLIENIILKFEADNYVFELICCLDCLPLEYVSCILHISVHIINDSKINDFICMKFMCNSKYIVYHFNDNWN